MDFPTCQHSKESSKPEAQGNPGLADSSTSIHVHCLRFHVSGETP
jgi:hypothetical protein